jgi:hypothetical protein
VTDFLLVSVVEKGVERIWRGCAVHLLAWPDGIAGFASFGVAK